MNKMTKGAIATGLGIALLVGGGGTLAVWNTTANANPGTIVSGDLDLKAGAGTWSNAKGPIEIADYKVVPGDVLTFTQAVQVTLEGQLLKAEITADDTLGTATKAPGAQTEPSFLEIGKTELYKGNVKVADTMLTPATAGAYTAKVTVTLPEKTDKRDGAALSTALSTITFKLDQKIDSKPVGTP